MNAVNHFLQNLQYYVSKVSQIIMTQLNVMLKSYMVPLNFVSIGSLSV